MNTLIKYQSESSSAQLSQVGDDCNLLIYAQDNYLGFFVFDQKKSILKAECFICSESHRVTSMEMLLAQLTNEKVNFKAVFVQLDFKQTVLIPNPYFDTDNISNYFTLAHGKTAGKELGFQTVENKDCTVVYNLIENIQLISIISKQYPDHQILPSSKPIISTKENYSVFFKISLRHDGYFFTHVEDQQLMVHQFVPVKFDSDYLNTILDFFNKSKLSPQDVVFIFDGFPEMAFHLEDKLVDLDFRVIRVHSKEFNLLPEVFSFLPMYPFYTVYQSLLCV